MQEQDGKLFGLSSKSYVVQRAKHDLYRCHPVQECYHAACVLWNLRESIKRGLLGHRAPDCSTLVDKLHREDRDERVHYCLGETLWMAGDHCT